MRVRFSEWTGGPVRGWTCAIRHRYPDLVDPWRPSAAEQLRGRAARVPDRDVRHEDAGGVRRAELQRGADGVLHPLWLAVPASGCGAPSRVRALPSTAAPRFISLRSHSTAFTTIPRFRF